jgi:hypothetical protein
MNDFEIVKNYMDTKYPQKLYTMQNANNCIWVSMGLCDMYFILRDGKIVDIQVD